MKTLVRENVLIRMTLCIGFLFALPIAQGAEPNNFFRWGLKLRVADPEGIHLAAK